MEEKSNSRLLQFFEAELKLGSSVFSNEDARVEFYTFTHGMSPAVVNDFLNLLLKYRPPLWAKIEKELANV